MVCFKQTMTITPSRLSSKNFTWSILEYFISFTFICKRLRKLEIVDLWNLFVFICTRVNFVNMLKGFSEVRWSVCLAFFRALRSLRAPVHKDPSCFTCSRALRALRALCALSVILVLHVLLSYMSYLACLLSWSFSQYLCSHWIRLKNKSAVPVWFHFPHV